MFQKLSLVFACWLLTAFGCGAIALGQSLYVVRSYTSEDLIDGLPNFRKIVCGDESYAKLMELTPDQRESLMYLRDDCFEQLNAGLIPDDEIQTWLQSEFARILLPSQMAILNDVATIRHVESELYKALNPLPGTKPSDSRDAVVAKSLGIEVDEWKRCRADITEIGKDLHEQVAMVLVEEFKASIDNLPAGPRRTVSEFLDLDNKERPNLLIDANLQQLIADRQAFLRNPRARRKRPSFNPIDTVLATLSRDEIGWLELSNEQATQLRSLAEDQVAKTKRPGGGYRFTIGSAREGERRKMLEQISEILLPHQITELQRIVAWHQLRVQLLPDFLEFTDIPDMDQLTEKEQKKFRESFRDSATKSLEELKKIQDEMREKIVEKLPVSLRPKGSVAWYGER